MKKKSYIFIAAALTVCAGVSCQKSDIYIDVEQDLYEVPAVYTELNIPVRCNTSSTAAVRYDGEETGWILLLPSLLGGDGVYSLWIEENQSEAETRSATLVITAGTSTREVKVVQDLMTSLSVTPSYLATTTPSGTYQLQISSTGKWTVTPDPDTGGWLSVDKTSGEGNSTVNLTFSEPGNDSEVYNGTVTVSTEISEVTVTVQHGYAQEIDGVVWAKANVGEPGTFASSPDDPGMLYQYNSRTGWENPYPDVTVSRPVGMPAGELSGPAEWADENNPCPDGWKVPTMEQVAALVGSEEDRNYGWLEASEDGFSIPGAVLGLPQETARTATAADMKGGIFLPCSGNFSWRTPSTYQNPGHATMNTATNKDGVYRYVVKIMSDTEAVLPPGTDWSWGENNAAYSVRCVKDERVSYGPVDIGIPGYDEGQRH